MSDRPFLSILLPSRNRRELFKHAMASIAAQGESDIEIIVSDNASSEDYARLLRKFSKFKLRHIRLERPVSVTENWNRALNAATGRYVVMLGDDDALSPGFVRRITEIADAYDQPEAIYMMAYHYAYPGVFGSNPLGYFCTVDNSLLFKDAAGPYEPLPEHTVELARQALRFRHLISFNAQHFVWRRDFIRRIAKDRDFFQPPYPDYFACFMTFLNAKRMVVVPSPQIIIGIAKQSFGFFYVNNREAEGQAAFLNVSPDEVALADGDEEALAALRFPGSQHYRNWLIAALLVRRRMRPDMALDLNLRRYRRVQLSQLAHQVVESKTLGRSDYWRAIEKLDQADRTFGRAILRDSMVLDRIRTVSRDAAFAGLSGLLSVYYPAQLSFHDIGEHQNIGHAVKWLFDRDQAGMAAEPVKPSDGADSPADSSSA